MRILITGAAGFIGSHTALEFLRNDHEVIGIDDLSSYYSVGFKKFRVKNLSHEPNFRFVQMNLSNSRELTSVIDFTEIDLVIHLAAQPGVRVPFEESSRYSEDNLLAFGNILNHCVEFKVKNFIFASSSSVYGDNSLPFEEDNINLLPKSYYGATKLSNEVLARSAILNSSTRAIGLRFFTVYGPLGRPDMAYFKILRALQSEAIFNMFGDGTDSRDFTYITDVVSAINGIVNNLDKIKPGLLELLNIGGGQPRTLLDLIYILENLNSKKLNIIQHGRAIKDVQHTLASTAKLANLIGFKPETNLETGLEAFNSWGQKMYKLNNFQNWEI